MTNPRPLKRKKKSSSSTSSLPESINNFTLFPITLPSPIESVPSAVHVLYLRRHEESPRPPSIASPESSRTIFVVNVPVDSTKEILRGLFAGLGSRLEDVRFHKDNDDLEDIEKLKLPDTWDRKLICTGGSVHITFPTEEDVNKI